MRAGSLAWVGWAVTISLVAGALVLGLANRPEAPLYETTSTIINPTFATLGALIVSRRPGNVIGWIFLACGVSGGVLMFSGQYATVALAPENPTLPGVAIAAWLANLAQGSFVVSILFPVLLFPDGMLPSRRWGPLAWAMGTFIAAFSDRRRVEPRPYCGVPLRQ
jgi:Na+-transporting NADH:ubiquinone oxidoreductase subunit NqrB